MKGRWKLWGWLPRPLWLQKQRYATTLCLWSCPIENLAVRSEMPHLETRHTFASNQCHHFHGFCQGYHGHFIQLCQRVEKDGSPVLLPCNLTPVCLIGWIWQEANWQGSLEKHALQSSSPSRQGKSIKGFVWSWENTDTIWHSPLLAIHFWTLRSSHNYTSRQQP